MSIAIRRQSTPFDETQGAFTAATPSCCCCCCCLATLVTGIALSGKVPYNQARRTGGNAVAAAVAGALSIPAIFGFAALLAWFGTSVIPGLEGLGWIGPIFGIGLFSLAGHFAKGSVPLYLAGGLGLGLVLFGVAIGEAIAVLALFSAVGSSVAIAAWIVLGVVGGVMPFVILKTPSPNPTVDAGGPTAGQAGWPSASQPFDHSDFGAPPAVWGQVVSPGPPPSTPQASASPVDTPGGPPPFDPPPSMPQSFDQPPPSQSNDLPRLDDYPFLDPVAPTDQAPFGPPPAGPPPIDSPPWDQPPNGDQPR